METKNKITPAEEYEKGFGFERALMLMREGKKVKQLRANHVFEIKEDTLYCDGAAVVAIGLDSVIKERWAQVY